MNRRLLAKASEQLDLSVQRPSHRRHALAWQRRIRSPTIAVKAIGVSSRGVSAFPTLFRGPVSTTQSDCAVSL